MVVAQHVLSQHSQKFLSLQGRCQQLGDKFEASAARSLPMPAQRWRKGSLLRTFCVERVIFDRHINRRNSKKFRIRCMNRVKSERTNIGHVQFYYFVSVFRGHEHHPISVTCSNDNQHNKHKMAQPAPLPTDEEQRLQGLRDLESQLLDTSPERVFDDITELTKKVFDVPIVLISLVDENRQWFKSCIGLSVSETPRELAFCAYAILDPTKIFIVPDTHKDPRFANNPLVTGDPYIRFYAGAPLKLDCSESGLGTLCIIDRKPRTITQADEEYLKSYASSVELAAEEMDDEEDVEI
ncbi:diguanylate cyclase [Planoprotostelium fungivorum]|uniref:Diguanylate cyclase n=1 Tax=Planoprotostelium fungivorum TaxID=1890364 RepID=A0A2P6NSM1_9EUKA|nr:diguanylate cyclase [Planoprotostelium fungivorum]